MTRSVLLLLLLSSGFVALAANPPAVRADEDAATRRARRYFERGEKLFALGRFADALEAYERAFEAKALPDFLFNIGQCHRNLGDYESAIFSYRKYLKLAPDAHNRVAVEQLIEDLERKLDERDRAERDRKLGLGTPPDRDDGGGVSPWWYVGGGVAAVAITVGAVVLLSGDDGPSIPDSDLGNLDFGQ